MRGSDPKVGRASIGLKTRYLSPVIGQPKRTSRLVNIFSSKDRVCGVIYPASSLLPILVLFNKKKVILVKSLITKPKFYLDRRSVLIKTKFHISVTNTECV